MVNIISQLQTKIETSHLGYLDSLRALAALTVVLCHATGQIFWPTYPPHSASREILNGAYMAVNLGHYCVDLFIVLSGFCLMLQVIKNKGALRGGAMGFYVRRGWRIIPPYYCSLLLSLLLIWSLIGHKTGTHWDVSLPVTHRSIIEHLLLVNDFFQNGYTINHALWSVAVEWRIYFLFPLILIGWRYWGITTATLLTLAASFLLYHGLDSFTKLWLCSHYLGLFAMGVFASTIVFATGHDSLRKLPWATLTLWLVPVVIVLSDARYLHLNVPVYIDDYFVGLWAMSFLITTSLNKGAWHYRLLSYPPLTFIGTFSYSIYLIHAPLLQVLSQYVFWPLQVHPWAMLAALTLVGMPSIVVASYLFFLVFERPFISMRSRKRSTVEYAPVSPQIA
jgi:peptidoglycan/LPS O-acetylase OafA/YrhL